MIACARRRSYANMWKHFSAILQSTAIKKDRLVSYGNTSRRFGEPKQTHKATLAEGNHMTKAGYCMEEFMEECQNN